MKPTPAAVVIEECEHFAGWLTFEATARALRVTPDALAHRLRKYGRADLLKRFSREIANPYYDQRTAR